MFWYLDSMLLILVDPHECSTNTWGLYMDLLEMNDNWFPSNMFLVRIRSKKLLNSTMSLITATPFLKRIFFLSVNKIYYINIGVMGYFNPYTFLYEIKRNTTGIEKIIYILCWTFLVFTSTFTLILIHSVFLPKETATK